MVMRGRMSTLIVWQLVVAGFLSSQTSVVAFQPLSPISSAVQHLRTERVPGLGPGVAISDARPCVRTGMVSKRSDESAENVSDPDRVRRRQLLVSMLATVSASSWVKDSNAEAEGFISAAPVSATGSESIINVIKSPLDDREYFTYTLNNGLRVLLCSDPSSNEAASAMDVHVGACSDPAEVPGLAHFQEHMLFLGTKKYPDEASFEKFLSSNGGTSNAYTDSENTVYYFAMQAEADSKLSEGLSRFGSFFTSPLFTESATSRELLAIESENAKNLESDIFRVFQIAKSRANPKHPFSKFFTGNKKTLLDDTKAQGINLRDQLIQFHDKYYSANQMTLAVVAPQSIAALKKIVEDSFGDIPNRNVGKPEEAWAGTPPFTVDSLIPSFNHVVEIVPVMDLRQVTVAWPVAFASDKERLDSVLIKPSNYVAHLLGHEGPRSLFSYLKRRGWANSLACAQEEELSGFETFEVVVGLTTEGLAAVDNIIEAIYSYLSLLRDKKIPDYVFNEVLQLEELQWRFATKNGAGGYVQSLATAMQKYPPPLYIAGPRRLAVEEYDVNPALLSAPRASFSSREQLERTCSQAASYADKLTVDNAIVTVLSKTFEKQADQKEKWYGTNYRVRAIPSSTIDQWKNCARPSQLKIDFPKPNLFIPSESGLRVKIAPPPGKQGEKKTFESRMVPITPPTVIRDDGPKGRWTVHYKADDRFGQPKAYMIFQILTKEVYSSPMRAALANFYEICITDHLDEYVYDAGLAGLIYDVKLSPRGIRLTLAGYNDKLKEFAAYISKKLAIGSKDTLPKDDQEFDRYKDQLMRGLSGFDAKQPYAHASYYAQMALQPRSFQYSNRELRDATQKITLPDLAEYVKTLWSSGKGEALVQGNFDREEALDLVKTIDSVLPFRPIPESEYPPHLEALPLPISDAKISPTRLLVTEPNPSNGNSVAHVMLQSLGKSETDHVLIELISAIASEPFFNELRTKQQLGYVVSSGLKGIGGSRTLTFIVQSSVAPAEKLGVEIIKFLDSVEERLLEKLSKGDVASYVKSSIDRRTEPDKDLAVEVTRNWSEIATGRLQFDRIQREAAALLGVEKQDLLDFWKKLYSGDGRRVLITEMIPRQGVASSPLPQTSYGYDEAGLASAGLVLGIDDIDKFRLDRETLGENQILSSIQIASIKN